MPTTDQLSAQLDRLAAFDAGPFPVVSLYLNLQPNQHGRDNFESFLRKELADRIRTYAPGGPERHSLERDAERVRGYVNQIDPSVDGLALFSCSGVDFFEAVALAAPFGGHRLCISDQPHLYPLARVLDEYPRYAVLLTDTNSARLFVVAANTVQHTEQLESTKTRRHKMGGWAQARYQRHIDNFHVHHAKEVAEMLARVVREEAIDSIVIGGDEVVVPLLKDHLPKELADRVVDVLSLGVWAPERDVLRMTIAAMREKDATTDREHVTALLDAYRAGGLAVVGVRNTARALEMGQVDELIITAVPDTIEPGDGDTAARRSHASERTPEERAADALLVKARQTGSRIRFIEDASLLAAVGGVGALLRYKI